MEVLEIEKGIMDKMPWRVAEQKRQAEYDAETARLNEEREKEWQAHLQTIPEEPDPEKDYISNQRQFAERLGQNHWRMAEANKRNRAEWDDRAANIDSWLGKSDWFELVKAGVFDPMWTDQLDPEQQANRASITPAHRKEAQAKQAKIDAANQARWQAEGNKEDQKQFSQEQAKAKERQAQELARQQAEQTKRLAANEKSAQTAVGMAEEAQASVVGEGGARGAEQDENFAFFEQAQADKEQAAKDLASAKAEKDKKLKPVKEKEAANRKKLVEDAKAGIASAPSKAIESLLPGGAVSQAVRHPVNTAKKVVGGALPAVGSAIDALAPSNILSGGNKLTGGAFGRLSQEGRERGAGLGSKAMEVLRNPVNPIGQAHAAHIAETPEGRKKLAEQYKIQNEKGNYGGARANFWGTQNIDRETGMKGSKDKMNISAEEQTVIDDIQAAEKNLNNPEWLKGKSQGEIDALKNEIDNFYGQGPEPVADRRESTHSAGSQWMSRLLYGDRMTPYGNIDARKGSKMKKGVDPEQEDDHYRVNKQPAMPPLAPPPGAPPPMPMDMSGMDPNMMGIGQPMMPQEPPNMAQGPPHPETGEPRKRGKSFTVDPEEESDDEEETSMNKSVWFNVVRKNPMEEALEIGLEVAEAIEEVKDPKKILDGVKQIKDTNKPETK